VSIVGHEHKPPAVRQREKTIKWTEGIDRPFRTIPSIQIRKEVREGAERYLRHRTRGCETHRYRTGLPSSSEEMQCEPGLAHARLACEHESTTVRRSPPRTLDLAVSADERPRCPDVMRGLLNYRSGASYAASPDPC
jgi:hypothetical protein